MSGWAIFWIVVLLVIVWAIAMNAKDIKRYYRIRNM